MRTTPPRSASTSGSTSCASRISVKSGSSGDAGWTSCSCSAPSTAPSMTLEGGPLDDALAFLDGDRLIRLGRGKLLDLAARPMGFEPRDLRRAPQAERHRQLALREIARSGFHHCPDRATAVE